MSTFRDNLIELSPPRIFFTAAVAIAVLGHNAFTATPWDLNS